MKHKHYNCIVAWAAGLPIEVSFDGESWTHIKDPAWNEDTFYRIKKEPVVEFKYFYLDYDNDTGWNEYKQFQPDLEKWDLKITYHDDVAVKVELPKEN